MKNRARAVTESSGQPIADEMVPHFFERLEPRMLLSATLVDGTLTLTGTEANDRIEIEAGPADGDVAVEGVAGVDDDTVFNGVDAIIINTLGGNDRVEIGSGVVDTIGAAIGVVIDGGSGNDKLEGGDGDDDIDGGSGKDKIHGHDGDDTLNGGDGGDKIDGGDGDDTITGGGGKDKIGGGDGDDDIDGGDGGDKIDGDDGNDTIRGMAGRDKIRGGDGDDDLEGGDDDDDLRGDDGDDALDGGDGDDKLKGGHGSDHDDDDNDDFKDDDDEDDDVPPVVGDTQTGDTITEAEANNTKPTANAFVLTSGTAQTLEGTSTNHRDKDFFRFTATANGTVDVSIASVSGPLVDLEVEGEGEEEDLLELEPDDGGSSTGSFSVIAGRTYFIRLRGPDNEQAPSQYAIELTFTPAAP